MNINNKCGQRMTPICVIVVAQLRQYTYHPTCQAATPWLSSYRIHRNRNRSKPLQDRVSHDVASIAVASNRHRLAYFPSAIDSVLRQRCCLSPFISLQPLSKQPLPIVFGILAPKLHLTISIRLTYRIPPRWKRKKSCCSSSLVCFSGRSSVSRPSRSPKPLKMPPTSSPLPTANKSRVKDPCKAIRPPLLPSPQRSPPFELKSERLPTIPTSESLSVSSLSISGPSFFKLVIYGLANFSSHPSLFANECLSPPIRPHLALTSWHESSLWPHKR